MADAKITALTELTTPAVGDLLAIVDDPAGSPITKKITCANLLSLAYPIGSIYISINSTNPGTSLGFGTWSAFGAGKVLVGLDAGDTDFDVDEETGGAKTHTLTSDEMPAHTHTQDAHSHVENAPSSASSGAMKLGIDTNASGSQDAGISTATTVAVNQNTGGGAAHSIVQPYIVVRFWKRTA